MFLLLNTCGTWTCPRSTWHPSRKPSLYWESASRGAESGACDWTDQSYSSNSKSCQQFDGQFASGQRAILCLNKPLDKEFRIMPAQKSSLLLTPSLEDRQNWEGGVICKSAHLWGQLQTSALNFSETAHVQSRICQCYFLPPGLYPLFCSKPVCSFILFNQEVGYGMVVSCLSLDCWVQARV